MKRRLVKPRPTSRSGPQANDGLEWTTTSTGEQWIGSYTDSERLALCSEICVLVIEHGAVHTQPRLAAPDRWCLERRLEELIHPPKEQAEEEIPMIRMTQVGDDVM